MKGIKDAKISTAEGLALIAVVAIGLSYYLVTSAHHNSMNYEFIESNENFDKMEKHEEAYDNLTDRSNMDSATTRGTYTDTSTQSGAMDGATTRSRNQ